MKNIIKWAKPVIQAIISALLLGLLITCGLLPVKYLGIAAAVVLLLLLITVLSSRSDNVAARSLGTILAIAVCLVLAFGVVYLHQVMRTLDRVSGSNTEINNILVIVAHGNPAQKIEETSGYTFGVYEGADTTYVDQMKEEIEALNGDAEIKVETFASALDLAQAILDGKVDAAICNQSYTALIEDEIADYSTQTRVIYEKEFETELDTDYFKNIDSSANDTTVQPDSDSQQKSAAAKNISLTEDSYTILISGIDVSGPINTTSRSDVNIM